MTQLDEYNLEHNYGAYTRPCLDLYWMNKYSGFLTKGMSDLEMVDWNEAKQNLENYEKIYEIVEYVGHLNENITLLQRRMMTNNYNIYQQPHGPIKYVETMLQQ